VLGYRVITYSPSLDIFARKTYITIRQQINEHVKKVKKFKKRGRREVKSVKNVFLQWFIKYVSIETRIKNKDFTH